MLIKHTSMIKALEYCLRWTPRHDLMTLSSVCNILTPSVLALLGVSHHPDLRGGARHVRPPQPDVVAVAVDHIEHEDGDSQDDGTHPDVFLL